MIFIAKRPPYTKTSNHPEFWNLTCQCTFDLNELLYLYFLFNSDRVGLPGILKPAKTGFFLKFLLIKKWWITKKLWSGKNMFCCLKIERSLMGYCYILSAYYAIYWMTMKIVLSFCFISKWNMLSLKSFVVCFKRFWEDLEKLYNNSFQLSCKESLLSLNIIFV